jgi:hypothetical protein
VLEHADRVVTLGDGVGRELPSPAGRAALVAPDRE